MTGFKKIDHKREPTCKCLRVIGTRERRGQESHRGRTELQGTRGRRGAAPISPHTSAAAPKHGAPQQRFDGIPPFGFLTLKKASATRNAGAGSCGAGRASQEPLLTTAPCCTGGIFQLQRRTRGSDGKKNMFSANGPNERHQGEQTARHTDPSGGSALQRLHECQDGVPLISGSAQKCV